MKEADASWKELKPAKVTAYPGKIKYKSAQKGKKAESLCLLSITCVILRKPSIRVLLEKLPLSGSENKRVVDHHQLRSSELRDPSCSQNKREQTSSVRTGRWIVG